MRKTISLNGQWKWAIPGGEWQQITVPSSYLCVGQAIFEREFADPHSSGRTILTFEGINYEGRAYLNGEYLGMTLSYCHYNFDITDKLKENNVLRVEVRDLGSTFGPADGWCNYAGIVRSTYLTTVADTYAEDIFFHAELSDDFESAVATVEVTLAGAAADGEVECGIYRNGVLKASGSATARNGAAEVVFDVEKPELWSPEFPFLYELRTTVKPTDGSEGDVVVQEIGFKKFVVDEAGTRFLLNGKPIYLRGVCRHDLMYDETVAFTQTDEQLESDIRMIKDLGVNFVRLVHYPHDNRVVRLADKYGLLVSEESGLWWSDMSNKQLTDSALEVMRRTMLRNRSNVSIAFWLAFNECNFTDEYLRDSVAVCRKYDPYRLISGANCMDYIRTRKSFGECGIDFYTFHPYGTYIDNVSPGSGNKDGRIPMRKVLEYLDDKPVVFTEWGGWYVDKNPQLFKEFCLFMDDCYHGRHGNPAIAGMSYWAWADMYEYNRNDHACHDGIQIEGLVTTDRKPKEIYYAYHEYLSKGLVLHDETPEVYVENAVSDPLDCTPYAMPNPWYDEVQRAAWDAACMDARTARNIFNRKNRTVKYGPVLPALLSNIGTLRVDLAHVRPIIVGDNCKEYTIAGGRGGKYLYFLGNVLFAHGHPTYGEIGEHVADYVIEYADGTTQTVALRNGIELTTVCSTFGSTKINPVVCGAIRAVTYSYNKNAENYIINMMKVETASAADVKSVSVRMVADDYCLLLYGVTAATPIAQYGVNPETELLSK